MSLQENSQISDIDARIALAKQLWQQGLDAESIKDFHQAHQLYTQAHDLITDCARLHQYAHKQLRRVNWRIGNYGELMTDWALHFFTPFGVFEVVAHFSKQPGRFHAGCTRNA